VDVLDGECCTYTFTLSREGVSVDEREAENPTARIAGSTATWIAAFSPDRDRTGLEISGRRQLAEALLDGLSALRAADAGSTARRRAA
jgi:hypothetical protein